MTTGYPPKTIEAVTALLASWEQRHPVTSRLEHEVKKEFRLLLQYAFIFQDPNPARPARELVLHWLRMSEGFDVHDLRMEVLRRVCAMTRRDDLAVPGQNGFQVRFPDFSHLWRWYRYHSRIHQRSRKIFSTITTEKILDAEIKTSPFYQAQAPFFEKQGGNVYDESHLEVVKAIQRMPAIAAPHILDIGCGDGRLLAQLRKFFPDASLVGSNIFGTSTVIAEVLEDKNTRFVTDAVEHSTFPDASFDIIVSTEVIEHLAQPGKMVDEIHRLLKPGGVFVVTAPSVHVQYLSKNPMTYLASALSVLWDKLLPPFHNLYEPLTDLPLIHYAFSVQQFKRLFATRFPKTRILATRFIHLRKFRLDRLAPSLPVLRRFGGLVMAVGKKTV